MNGHLRLAFAADPARGTWLAEQSFRAPMHLSKTYRDGETLLVNIVNQTAGVFGGDSISTRVTAGANARVLLSGPSAARFHPSRGREAWLDQTFEIHPGARLEFLPELAIPQRDSRTFQRTRIDVVPGGELIYLETLAPGRVASGEAFAFERYAWQTDVRLGGRLIHRERAALGHDSGTASLRALFPASYHAALLVISPAAETWDDSFPRQIGDLSDAAAYLAASRLTAGGWNVRTLAADSVALRRVIRGVRTLIYGRLGAPMPDPRRTGA